MNQIYAEYLNSEAWHKRRAERLAISNGRCSACNQTHKLQVHHLTYERIFNEPMEDLLPLCNYHHEAAEELVRQGKLPRFGNVLFLATETVRLVSQYGAKLHKYTKQPQSIAQPKFSTAGSVVLTKRTVHQLVARRGGFKQSQSELLGVEWPPRKGWMKNLFGMEIAHETWQKLLRLRDTH